jgi:hypothetical protein
MSVTKMLSWPGITLPRLITLLRIFALYGGVVFLAWILLRLL